MQDKAGTGSDAMPIIIGVAGVLLLLAVVGLALSCCKKKCARWPTASPVGGGGTPADVNRPTAA